MPKYVVALRTDDDLEESFPFEAIAPTVMAEFDLAMIKARNIAKRWLRNQEWFVPTGKMQVTAYFHVWRLESPDSYHEGEVSVWVSE